MKNSKQHTNSVNTTAEYDVPFEVHSTEASALGGTSPEMTQLTKLTMKGTYRD